MNPNHVVGHSQKKKKYNHQHQHQHHQNQHKHYKIHANNNNIHTQKKKYNHQHQHHQQSHKINGNNNNISHISPNSTHSHSGSSDPKDDAKDNLPQIGYTSGSNTLSPQQSSNNNKQLNNNNNNSNNNNNDNINVDFVINDVIVKQFSQTFGFEEEWVRMALIQAQGDKSYAAEILFQRNEQERKAIKKLKNKKKHSIPHFNSKLMTDILGKNVRDIKKEWRILIGDNSKSDLRRLAMKECILDDDSDTSSSNTSSDESDYDTQQSFYKKNKNAIPTLCQSSRNILFILRLYENWKVRTHTLYNKPLDLQLNECYFHILINNYLPHYSLIQLINDFQHIHIYHWDHCELFNEFEKIFNECFITQCISFKRHYRDRYKYINGIKRYKLYLINLNNNTPNGNDDLIKNEIVCMQWMDEIHCYLRHSLMKFELNNDDNTDDDDDIDDTDDDNTSRDYTATADTNSYNPSSYGLHSPSNSKTNASTINTINSGFQYKLNRQLMNQRKEELSKNSFGRSYCRYLTYNDINNGNDDIKYNNNNNNDNIGIFEWQSTINASQSNVKPKFSSMKQEMLNNPYYQLTLLEYDELYLKCEQIGKSWIRKKIKAKSKYSGIIGFNNDNNNKKLKLKIKKSDPIPIELICAVKLYTDYDKLQYELKKCLRRTNDKYINDLSYLYWWRSMISIAISKYGIKMKKHKFFYGSSSKLELNNDAGFGLFNGPLSLTISLEVAKQYSGNNGMLMQIGNAYPWIKSYGNDNDIGGNGRYFDVSPLSDYKNEHEILTMLFYTRLHMISLNCYIDENINNLSWNLFLFVCKLFNKCIFSMNYELENIFIQLLNNQLELHQNNNNVNYNNNGSIPKKYINIWNKMCCSKENLILWDISMGLQDFFMINSEYDDDFDDESTTINNMNKHNINDDEKILISFEKINNLFINIKKLTLINHILSDEIFYQFIDYLKKNKGNISYEIITFYYPKFKRLPGKLRINQLQHVWEKHLKLYKWEIVGYKYGSTLSPMIVIQKIGINMFNNGKPFMGYNKNAFHHFVKINK